MNPAALSRSFAAHLPLAEGSLRILLVEDNPAIRRLLTLILRRDGHDVVGTKNGVEAMDALASLLLDDPTRDCDVDVIISEEYLPGILGLTVLAALRACDHQTPFVLIAGSPEVQEQARRLGALTLNHPLNVKAIRGVVRQSAAAVRRA